MYDQTGILIFTFISLCSCQTFGGFDIDKDILNKVFESVEPCTYRCSTGVRPRPNPNHVPSSNGCGALGVEFDFGKDSSEMTKCCDEHDICYDTCNSDRAKCDKKFHQCLVGVCHKFPKHKKACLQTTEIMFRATQVIGCVPYNEAQMKACTCDERDEL